MKLKKDELIWTQMTKEMDEVIMVKVTLVEVIMPTFSRGLICRSPICLELLKLHLTPYQPRAFLEQKKLWQDPYKENISGKNGLLSSRCACQWEIAFSNSIAHRELHRTILILAFFAGRDVQTLEGQDIQNVYSQDKPKTSQMTFPILAYVPDRDVQNIFQ